MIPTIDREDFVRMIRAAAGKINAEHEMLSKLDAATGDGDHGTTMKRAMGNAEKAIDESAGAGLGDLLQNIAWAVMGTDGGATGPLFGTFFMGLSEGIGAVAVLDAPAVATAFESGLASIQKQTPAKLGDKTMLDALIPAVEALRKAAGEGQDVAAVLAQAAAAAEAGAAATKNLRARQGRARNLGDRSIGSQDPGATSVGLMFRGFAEALAAGR
jgi:phosphoenolpyruvate---glycerone phosphotransferase subunit DhaL